MDDIAAASSVSRATLFRRYGNKDELFERALRFAVHSMLSKVGRIFVAVPDSTERIVETFAACMRFGSTVVPADADPHHTADMLEVLTRGTPSVMDLAHQFVAGQIADGQEDGRIPSVDPDMKADALIRITLGYLATPDRRFDLSDPHTVRTIARTVIAPIVTALGQHADSA
ncbi:TetR/AcrR family transcriptional regulator [Nocardia aurantiaca]|uniref:TetR family transcriptional regulator n=1 Tax=Nocardia aurantiaca TaxID=2675850 RepID=A0A6I3KZ15_9NOCA|nr:TetR/AcrR family transcriptional regulator [Nocardia aurantiaca]MTE13706.1 TetR family transcriptional regulator [Nocardia aurantiaca]